MQMLIRKREIKESSSLLPEEIWKEQLTSLTTMNSMAAKLRLLKTETRVEGVINLEADPDPVEDQHPAQEDQDPTQGDQDPAQEREIVIQNQDRVLSHDQKVGRNLDPGQSLETDPNQDPVPSLEDQTESHDLPQGRGQSPEADPNLAQSKEKSPNQNLGHALNQNLDRSLVLGQGLAQDHPHEDRKGPDPEVPMTETETRKQDQSLLQLAMQLMEKLVTMVLINFFYQ